MRERAEPLSRQSAHRSSPGNESETVLVLSGGETSREVAPGIHRIVMPVGERINSCYAFVGARRVLLFDTALDGDISRYVAPYLESIGRRVQDVAVAVISHGDVDHFGGNAELAALVPQALIACHQGDLELVADPDFVFAPATTSSPVRDCPIPLWWRTGAGKTPGPRRSTWC